MYEKILNVSNNIIKQLFEQEKLDNLQNILFRINIYVKVEDLISLTLIASILLFFITLIMAIIYDLPVITALPALVIIPLVLINYIFYKNSQLNDRIEEDLPLYLHQISSLLKVGLGLESALGELSETTRGPLNNEIKRALAEMKFGKSFDEALIGISKRNSSENLKHTFEIIIHSKQTGANLADILDMIADDLSESIMLKKERKAGIMMSVMFLIISSTVAIPFSLSMIGIYSDFIQQAGRDNPLAGVIPVAGTGYILIHSVLASILIGVVMYSDYRKSLKFIFTITPGAIAVYYMAQGLFKSILLTGF